MRRKIPRTVTKNKKINIEIQKPTFCTAHITIVGTAPYVQNRFSERSIAEIKASLEQGTVLDNKKRFYEAKDFQVLYEEAKHISTQGWCGIPAPGIRKAMLTACTLLSVVRDRDESPRIGILRKACFIEADGFDCHDGTPLVKIVKGEPHYVEHRVSLAQGQPYIRARPMWDVGWQAVVRIKFDIELISDQDIVNLLMRAGIQVGIGEGRPERTNDMGWGTFELLQNKVIN